MRNITMYYYRMINYSPMLNNWINWNNKSLIIYLMNKLILIIYKIKMWLN